MSVLILQPTKSEAAYTKAANVFKEYYNKITGINLPVCETDDGVSDLVVIGSDAVNDFLLEEVLELRLKSLGIRYGTDDYCIKSHKSNNRRVLILAGGRGRSTLYAVYDYFERFGGCHYFWDGDVIPSRDSLPMEDIDVNESPRFYYRGLRYFAHRGLKRFQAEHWSLDDWKQELDWMTKKRLNFFMLRIGMDDVWQKAFPDAVPYPEEYRTIDGTDAEGFNDRSDFWSLKYRGELRAKILDYARELDLMYPTDCGTMTHWYSRTPKEFLNKIKPTFVNQEVAHYTESDTGKVFDFTKKENMDYYIRLTETMVDNYEKNYSLFHTIGLGERRLYKDKDKNFALKLLAYRRIAQSIKSKYPESKLMLASWDFAGLWNNDEVISLFDELDPQQIILLDYTSDMVDPDHSFLNWGVVGKFPYVFGLFHAYEAETELRGAYDRTDKRLKIAADDPFCKGMIFWPELSHSDPIVLEYLSENSWAPLEKSVEQIAQEFCFERYGEYAEQLNECWQSILPFIKLNHWGGAAEARPNENKGADFCQAWPQHQDLWTRLCMFMDGEYATREDLYEYFEFKKSESVKLREQIVAALKKLSKAAEALKNPFVLRDSIDIVRTVLGRFLNYTVIDALTYIGNKQRLTELKAQYNRLLEIMSDVLSLSDDFSLYHSLKELEKAAPTNPNFELTLKRNISNNYCTQPCYELINNIFKAEGEVVFDWLLKAQKGDKWSFAQEYKSIHNEFINTSLEDMKPSITPKATDVFKNAALYMEEVLKL